MVRACPVPRYYQTLGPVGRDEHVELEGEVAFIAREGHVRVRCDNGHEVLAELGDKLRKRTIPVALGDRVKVAISPYDPSRGFIVNRLI